MLEYKIFRDELSDTPLKTQVTMEVIVSGAITRESLERLLYSLYDSISVREGFKYSPTVTHIGIYAFVSEEHARSGMGQWIGMLIRTGVQAKPELKIDEQQIALLHAEPVERFGMTEDKRRIVFKEIVQAEDRAKSDSEKKSLKAVVAKKYRISLTDLEAIGVEGLEKNWPLPVYEE